MSAGGDFGCRITHWGRCSQGLSGEVGEGDEVFKDCVVLEMAKTVDDAIDEADAKSDSAKDITELEGEAFATLDTSKLGVGVDTTGFVVETDMLYSLVNSEANPCKLLLFFSKEYLFF